MKKRVRHHPLIAMIILIVLLSIASIGGYAIYLAGSVDALPWQAVPTPYVGGAFEGIPGFSATTATATATTTPQPASAP